MSLRVAIEADIPAIVRVVNRAYRVEEFFVTSDRTHADDVGARMRRPHGSFLVIDAEPPHSGGELVGAVFVDIRDTRGYFAMLSVDPDAQRRGYGRLLVNAAEAQCRAAGCVALDIDVVNVRVELPAFYARFGFTAFDVAPFPEPEKLLSDAHLVLMTKAI